MKAREYVDVLTAELERHGVTRWHTEPAGKHNRLHFHWQGRERRFMFPSSPSDKRGLEISLRDLRKAPGVKRQVRKSDRPKARQQPSPAPEPACPKLTVKPDPFEVLAKLRGE